MESSKFDYEKYSKILQKFVSDIQDTKFLGLDDRSSCLTALCEILRIGRIEMQKTLGMHSFPQLHGDLEDVYFNTEQADVERFFVVHELGGRLVSVDYTFYQIKGDPDWTPEETIRLATIGKILYTYSTAYLLMNYVNFSHFHDMRFKERPNLSFFQKFTGTLIEQNQLQNFGIAICNLQHFSLINRKVGQNAGTQLLEKYMDGLQDIVLNTSVEWEKGCVAALGGDTFAILFHKTKQPFIINYLSGADIPVVLETGETEFINVVSKTGMNLNLSGFKDAYDVMDSATMALNLARRREGIKVIFYDEDLKKEVYKQREIESLYADAIKNEEFQVFFQPKVDLHNYKLKGAEALVRWVHDDQIIYPDYFIPILEKNLSIKYLDLYILNHVCRYMAKWIEDGKKLVQISVNLSRASLSITNIVMVITSIIDRYQIPRSLIQIELTESASEASAEYLKSVVRELNQEGISTAMDDFGTGFSSLSLIKELPWDVLKIDKSLLEGAQKAGSHDQHMFKAIISMANEIGLECIVEGVETREDIKLLKESNCWMAQGFYFSKALDKDEFEKLLLTETTNPLQKL